MMRALVVVFLVISCVSASRPRPATLGRTPTEEADAVVTIRSICPDGKVKFGSGVVVGRTRVLTAAHVVICKASADEAKRVDVDPGDGIYYPARLVHVLSVRDVAALDVSQDLSRWLHPVVIGPSPSLGDRVCEAAAMPRPTYRCGDVEDVNLHEFYVSMFTEFGNSGSGTYDTQGRLIGLMVSTIECQDGFQCVGGVTLIAGLPELLE